MHRHKTRGQRFKQACCDDKAALFVFLLSNFGFGVILAGLISYFWQYEYTHDGSDEKWIYPILYLIPCFGWFIGFLTFAAGAWKKPKVLFVLPFISVFQILLLMFMCFIFYQAYHQGQRQLICNLSRSNQDITCAVTKDGHQICGHQALEALCQQILFMTTGCLRRQQILEDSKLLTRYSSLRDDDMEMDESDS